MVREITSPIDDVGDPRQHRHGITLPARKHLTAEIDSNLREPGIDPRMSRCLGHRNDALQDGR